MWITIKFKKTGKHMTRYPYKINLDDVSYIEKGVDDSGYETLFFVLKGDVHQLNLIVLSEEEVENWSEIVNSEYNYCPEFFRQ